MADEYDEKPYPGESPAEYRVRRKAKLEPPADSAPTPPSGFEAARAAVASKEAEKKARLASTPGKKAVNVDSAASDADELERRRDLQKHEKGVVKIDKAAADAAYKADASFAKKKPEEQAALARGVKKSEDRTSGAVHTTETPGSSHQTSMAAALAKAGVQGSAPTAKTEKKAPAAALPREVSERNNMGAPRGSVDNSVISGRSIEAEGDELQKAKDAAVRGTRGASNKKAEADAAETSQRRSAASAPAASAPKPAPSAPKVPGGRFVNGRTAAFSASMGISGPSDKLSDKPAAPAANPAPQAPNASAPNNFEGLAGPAAQSRAPMTRESVGLNKPKMGSEITYGVANPKSPAAKMREGYNAHIAGGGNTESYWAARDAKKAGKAAPKAAKAPKEAVAEQPSLATPKAESKASPAAAPAAPAPAPSRAPQAQKTPLSSQMSISGEGRDHSDLGRNWGPSSPVSPGRGPLAQQVTSRYSPERSQPSAPAAPTPEQAVTPKATGRTRSTGRVGTVSETVSSPRGGAVRGGGVSGGDHSVNVGGDNHGNIYNNHYSVNYGYVGGNMGDVSHGHAARGGNAGSGGGGGGAPQSHSAGSVRGDVWVKDKSGTHSLQGTIDHVSGRTGGSHKALPQVKAPVTHGGQQKAIAGSPRSAGGVNPAQMANPNAGTGTTNNWQGPQAGVTHPASGIGTANHGKTTE